MPLLSVFSFANPVVVDIGGNDRIFTYLPHTVFSYLYCLDLDKNVVWSTNLICSSTTMALIGITQEKDVLYVARDFTAIGIDPVNGDQLWSTFVNAEQVVGIGPDGCAYYAGEGSPGDVIAKVDKEGVVLWSRSLGRGGRFPAAFSFSPVTDDALYVSQTNLAWPPYLPPINVWLMKINPTTGEELWAIDLKSLYGETTFTWVMGLTLDKNVIVGSDVKTYCFRPDGTLKWSSPGGAFCSARDTDGTFYIVDRKFSGDASIRKCDPNNGSQTTIYTFSSNYDPVVAIGMDKNKRIYFTTQRVVRCIDTGGNLLWSYNIPGEEIWAAGLGLFKDRLFITLTDTYRPYGMLCFKTP